MFDFIFASGPNARTSVRRTTSHAPLVCVCEISTAKRKTIFVVDAFSHSLCVFLLFPRCRFHGIEANFFRCFVTNIPLCRTRAHDTPFLTFLSVLCILSLSLARTLGSDAVAAAIKNNGVCFAISTQSLWLLLLFPLSFPLASVAAPPLDEAYCYYPQGAAPPSLPPQQYKREQQ